MHEFQWNNDVLYSELLAVVVGASYLALAVVGTIVEGDGKGYLSLLVIEERDAVHAPGKNDE